MRTDEFDEEIPEASVASKWVRLMIRSSLVGSQLEDVQRGVQEIGEKVQGIEAELRTVRTLFQKLPRDLSLVFCLMLALLALILWRVW